MNKPHQRLFEWIAKHIYRPRFWSKKEWVKHTAKEKIWIWYKHHDSLMSTGNSELDKVMPFLKGEFLTTASVVAALFTLWNLPTWTFWAYPIFYMIYKLFQWFVGNELDKRDLIALTTDIGNKRNNLFRKLNTINKKESFRKEL